MFRGSAISGHDFRLFTPADGNRSDSLVAGGCRARVLLQRCYRIPSPEPVGRQRCALAFHSTTIRRGTMTFLTARRRASSDADGPRDSNSTARSTARRGGAILGALSVVVLLAACASTASPSSSGGGSAPAPTPTPTSACAHFGARGGAGGGTRPTNGPRAGGAPGAGGGQSGQHPTGPRPSGAPGCFGGAPGGGTSTTNN